MSAPLRNRTKEDGTVLVEFAFVLPLLLILVLGIADFGRAFNYWVDETHLANEAARFAAVNRNPGGPGSLADYIKGQATTSELNNGLTICITSSTGKVGDPLDATATYDFGWLAFFQKRLGFAPTTTLKGSATMRIEIPPTAAGVLGCST